MCQSTDSLRCDTPPGRGAGPRSRVAWWENPGHVCAFVATLAAASSFARPAWAHAFAQRYHLPAPFWLYLSGVVAAVVVSFAALAVFYWRRPGYRRRPGGRARPRVAVSGTAFARLPTHPYLLTTVRVLSVGAFVLVVAVGFFGEQNAFRNPASVFVWQLWWTGMVLVSAFLGNLWALINPWKIIFSWAEALHHRARPGGEPRPRRRYPAHLGAWPAVVLFLVFAWVALVWQGTATPAALASAVALYSLATWLGMAFFGKHRWLRRGEVFAVVFTLLARFAPTQARPNGPQSGQGPGWSLRLPASGLLDGRPLHPSLMALVLLVLAAAVFEGLGDTPVWSGIMDRVIAGPALWPLWSALERLGLGIFAAVKTVAWVLFAPLFVAAYLTVSAGVARAGGGRLSTGGVACRLALTLVPVILAYHLAHELVDLPVAARALVALAADPFGLGWRPFGASAAQGKAGTVDAALAWSVTVAAVAAGHALAVCLALAAASRAFGDPRVALRSQYPMMVFVSAHAALSLWILSRPIVGYAGG